ncbi:RimJ/RimL family protein N-acetyltransferase [Kibdelosporangium banguiense]|uniref:RimJ/RimL family protein N-acetyltransferase n=1 Tax=Kibdelosporangium banguiense TaxID=1365924 RepID=A0ABS4TCZ8_9PSEU|nr:GNAT family N-acetyltransferase [Kibdelosporangium banguiense]MBP2322303.1 RimJ/RimL family protein N-acetyltransferase [Kibdelosporangium banguiense]
MTELVVRPLTAGEEHLFDTYAQPDVVGFAVFGRTYLDYFSKNEYRPEWTWVALRGDRVVARAAWWAGPEDSEPLTLDWLDFEDPDAGEALLKAAPFTAEYCLALPPGWRDDPMTLAAGVARIEVAQRAGMKPLVERLRYTWTPADGVPERPGRLEFREEPDDEVIVDVLSRIQQGSLDAHKVADLKRMSPEEAARDELKELYWYPAPREWWKLAYTPAGELVGITVPSKNYGGPVVGFIGVVPDQRGHGYAYDLLVECTHLLVEEGVDEIVAETDVTNYPMAANFKRAGYPITQERVFLAY